MSAPISQKEYLKKYLGGSDADKKKKRKKKDKPSSQIKGMRIVEDSLDIKNVPFGYTDDDDNPTVAEITYEDEKMKIMEEFAENKKWKKIQVKDGRDDDGSDWLRKHPQRSDSTSSPRIPVQGSQSPSRKMRHGSNSPQRKTRKGVESPQRKVRHDSDSPPRKIWHDSGSSPRNVRHGSGSPPRKMRHDSGSPPRKIRHDSGSPPRKTRNNAGSPQRKVRHDSGTPPRKIRRDSVSPPRKLKQGPGSPPRRVRHDSGSPPRRMRHDSGSPPRKVRHDSSSPSRRMRHSSRSPPPPRKDSGASQQKERYGTKTSPQGKVVQKNQMKNQIESTNTAQHTGPGQVKMSTLKRSRHDSGSPPIQRLHHGSSSPRERLRYNSKSPQLGRKRNESGTLSQSHSDSLPARKGLSSDTENLQTSKRHDSDSSPSSPRRRHDSDTSPPRKKEEFQTSLQKRKQEMPVSHTQRIIPDGKNTPPKRRNDSDFEESDSSPPRKNKPDTDSSPMRQKRHGSDPSPPRRKRFVSDLSPPRRKKPDSTVSPQRRKRHDLDASPVRNKGHNVDASPPRKLLDSQKGQRQERKMTTQEYLSARKHGKLRKDTPEELARKEREAVLQRNAEEKHQQWKHGVKQVQDYKQKLADDAHEMGKAFSRTADDVDLNKQLKIVARKEDPMLEYMMKKEARVSSQAVRPVFKGPFPPNRLDIRPGYRWDGVDRSSGFEKRWFEHQNNKRAYAEDAYKWSVSDM